MEAVSFTRLVTDTVSPMSMAQSSTGLKIGAGLGAFVVLAGIGVGVVWLSSDGGTATVVEPEQVMDESATEIDLLNTEVLIPPTVDFTADSETITLTDGVFEDGDPDPFTSEQYEYHVEPVYADLDGDMDLDAAAILHYRQYERGYFYLIVWLWEDDDLVQVDRTISGACAIEALNPSDTGVEVTLMSITARESCYAYGVDETLNETITVSVIDGELVQSEPALGAIDRCHPLYWHMVVPVETPVTPRTGPGADSHVVAESGQYTEVRWLAPADGASRPNWHIVQVDVDGQTVCGWVADEELIGTG